jgi:hypothetical protein
MRSPLRHLDPTAGPKPGRGCEKRIAHLAMAGKDLARGELTDVSAYGCCVETPATWLRPGRFVAITLPGGLALESIVRWTRGSLAGLELLRPLAANRSDWLALID